MLTTALPVLQTEIQLTLQEAFQKAMLKTFPHAMGPDDKAVAMEIATKFATEAANTAAPRLALAINNFVMQADITGSPLGLITAVGPVTGAIAPKSLLLV